MKQKQIRRICGIFMVILLMMLTVSCRRNEGETVSTTTVTTTARTTEVTESTVEMPSLVNPTLDELCEIVNSHVILLFDGMTSEDYVDAEKMLDEMLPYLLGDDSPIPAEQTYHLNNVTVTGDRVAMPREVFYVDGIMTLDYDDPEYGTYREMEVCHENGTVYLSSLDGVTTVDGSVLNDTSETPMGDLDAETMMMIPEQLSEVGDGVYLLSNRYVRFVLNAIFGADNVTHWPNESMIGLLNAGELPAQGTLQLAIVLGDPAVIQLELSLEGIGGKREGTALSLKIGEEDEIRMACGTLDGSIVEKHMSIRSGELLSEATQTVNGTHIDLTSVTKSGDTVAFSCKMALDMTSAFEGSGTVEAIFRTGEQESNGVMMLSAAETITESVSHGEFSVRMEDGEVAMMDLAVITQAGSVVSEITMMEVRSGAAVGDAVMYYTTQVRDTADPSVNSFVALEAKLTSRAPTSAQYALAISVEGIESTSKIEATITAPAAAKPTYNSREQELIERAKLFLSKRDSYLAEAESTLNSMLRAVTLENVESFPPSFYIRDVDGDGIVILLHLVNDNGYYAYADVLLDVENYTYFYDRYDISFNCIKSAGIWADIEHIRRAVTEKSGYRLTNMGNAIGCYYREDQKVYVLVEAESGEHICLWEEPRSEDFPGYTLHFVKLGTGGVSAGEPHSFSSTYDERCYETLTCTDCGLVLIGELPDHDVMTERVICEAEGTQPHTAYANCARCHNNKRIILTDSRGNEIHFELTNATSETFSQMESYREGARLHESIDRGRDPATHLVIYDMHVYGSAFYADVRIPDLRGVTGETVLGLGRLSETDGYALPKNFSMNLILPEGMEFVIGSFLEGTVFYTASAVTLPSTMIHVDDVLGRSSIEELVIPASVKVIMGVDWALSELKRLVVEGDFDVLPAIYAPKLEELQLLGHYHEITGIRYGCMIEELIIPEGVESLGFGAFSDMSRLRRVVLPESLTELPFDCFKNCTRLQEVILPSSLTAIADYAFEGAENLKQITLPASVTRIESCAFRGCFRLREVTVLGELSHVAYDAFAECDALAEVPKAIGAQ